MNEHQYDDSNGKENGIEKLEAEDDGQRQQRMRTFLQCAGRSLRDRVDKAFLRRR